MQDRPSRSMNLVTNLDSQRVVYYLSSLSQTLAQGPTCGPSGPKVGLPMYKYISNQVWVDLVVDSGGLRGSTKFWELVSSGLSISGTESS